MQFIKITIKIEFSTRLSQAHSYACQLYIVCRFITFYIRLLKVYNKNGKSLTTLIIEDPVLIWRIRASEVLLLFRGTLKHPLLYLKS